MRRQFPEQDSRARALEEPKRHESRSPMKASAAEPRSAPGQAEPTRMMNSPVASIRQPQARTCNGTLCGTLV